MSFHPSGLPSNGRERQTTDHPPAPTMLPSRQQQGGSSRRGERRQVIAEDYRGERGPVSVHSGESGSREGSSRGGRSRREQLMAGEERHPAGGRSSGSSRSGTQFPRAPAPQAQEQPARRGGSMLQSVQQAFGGESHVSGREGLARMQRAPQQQQGYQRLAGDEKGPNRYGLPPKTVKFGPHKGKDVRDLTNEEREEGRRYKAAKAEKLANSFLFT